MPETDAPFPSENNLNLLPRMALFAAVVRQGGFSKAAAALGLSKSYVSKQIAQLEETLGARLLTRTTRLVRPTEAGELYYEQCVEVLRLAEDAQGVLNALQEQAVGRVRISIPLAFGRAFLFAPLLGYMEQFPRVEVTIDLSDRQVDILREDFDLAIRVGQVHNPELVVRKLCDSRRLVVAAPAYLETRGTPTTPAQLSEHSCLLYDYQARRDRWQFSDGKKKLEVPVAGRIRTNNGDMLAAAACAGLGLAWLPDFIAQPYINDGRLAVVLESACRDITAVHAVLPARKHMPVKVRELLRVIDEAMNA